MPTRSRPAQALHALAEYRRLAGCPVTMEVVVDEDDQSMKQVFVLKALRDMGCLVTTGKHGSKVEAVNGGRKDLPWDILVLASDDMMPVADGWATRLTKDMQDSFPQLDGALHYDDGHQADKLCTFPVQGRRLYQQFGYVYHPDYKSFFCDNEQTEVLKAMRRIKYVNFRLVEHRHPDAQKNAMDELYRKNLGPYNNDYQTYHARAARKFDLKPCRLSILIATMPQRASLLERLLDHLWAQVLRRPTEVEVLVDGAGGTTGAKRNRLLQQAIGDFVAFVDDDDWVCHDYVDRTLDAIGKVPEADCVEFQGAIMLPGQPEERFHHSTEYASWFKKDGIYRRCPNHLNAVRRTLALSVGFPDQTVYEDRDFSTRIQPLLKTQAPIGTDPLYFYFPSNG